MKKNPHLIITVDHEIFGNGSGCLNCCVVKPVEKMIRVADKFSAPLTFFVEVLEYQAMERAKLQGIDSVLYQLKKAYSNGHDLQLHLHPQWHDAKWNGKEWLLNNKLWRMGDLEPALAFKLLKEGKEWLESLLNDIDSSYKCLAFRAGGWCIQPSGAIVKGLIDLDFKIDSTVALGFRNLAKGEWSDFTAAPMLPYWECGRDICIEEQSGLLEVPITTGRIGKLRHIKSVYHSKQFGLNGMAEGCIGSYSGSSGKLESMKSKVSKLMDAGLVMLDISTMPSDVLIEISEQWLEKFSNNENVIPLVAIAHTKNFTEVSELNFNLLLSWASSNGVDLSTFKEWFDETRQGVNLYKEM